MILLRKLVMSGSAITVVLAHMFKNTINGPSLYLRKNGFFGSSLYK